MPKKEPRIKSVETTLRIVEHLSVIDEIGVTELAEEIGQSPATTYNHLNTLYQSGYVSKTDQNKYRIGFRFVNTAYQAKQRIPNYELIVDEVDKIAEETGEIAVFFVEEMGLGVCLYDAFGEHAVDRPVHEGYQAYLHDTAMGKAILAQLPRERVEEIIDRWGLPETGKNTISERAELSEELAEIREDGVAYNNEESQQGLAAVGAPIVPSDDDVLGAISVVGPTSRISEDDLRGELADIVRSSTNIIEVNDPTGHSRNIG